MRVKHLIVFIGIGLLLFTNGNFCYEWWFNGGLTNDKLNNSSLLVIGIFTMIFMCITLTTLIVIFINKHWDTKITNINLKKLIK